MDFLGQVNVFRGHVDGGRAKLGALDLVYPQHPHDQRRPASVHRYHI
jgi:hypothetical protein